MFTQLRDFQVQNKNLSCGKLKMIEPKEFEFEYFEIYSTSLVYS